MSLMLRKFPQNLNDNHNILQNKLVYLYYFLSITSLLSIKEFVLFTSLLTLFIILQ